VEEYRFCFVGAVEEGDEQVVGASLWRMIEGMGTILFALLTCSECRLCGADLLGAFVVLSMKIDGHANQT